MLFSDGECEGNGVISFVNVFLFMLGIVVLLDFDEG